jgi:26S proteasome non-ATPase regulatory subunit 10
MERAAEAAREGNAQYFFDLTDDNLIKLCQKKDEDGRTLLHSAVVGGNMNLVQLLVERCGSEKINLQDSEGWTPLTSAVSCGFEEIVKFLLSLGADPNSTNAQKRTPLHYAASKGRVPIVKLLIKAGAATNSKDVTGWLPLHRAASAGRAEALRELLLHTAKPLINARDVSGATPLLLACVGGHQAAAILLAAKGADVEAEDKDGQTPLGAAAQHGQLRDALVAIATGEKTLDDFES